MISNAYNAGKEIILKLYGEISVIPILTGSISAFGIRSAQWCLVTDMVCYEVVCDKSTGWTCISRDLSSQAYVDESISNNNTEYVDESIRVANDNNKAYVDESIQTAIINSWEVEV